MGIDSDFETALNSARAVPLASVVGRYTRLKRISYNGEMAGPCPRCGGTDRFHVNAYGWHCNQCHPKWDGDAISFIQWVENCSFRDAVGRLVNASFSQVNTKETKSMNATQQRHTTEWIRDANTHLDRCIADFPNSPGEAYLMKRGLYTETIRVFRVGYDKERHAIAMPWYRNGVLTGIRYRLITPKSKQKIVSYPGSIFANMLYGGQAMPPDWTARFPNGRDPLANHSFVLVEGEINAMSIWQVAHPAHVDVLSIGSETATLSEKAIETMGRFKVRLAWMDKKEIALRVAAEIGGGALWSERDNNGKQDANDCLRNGTLQGILEGALYAQAPEHEREGMRYDLADMREHNSEVHA